MNKYKRLGKNTILVFVGNAGGKLIGLLMLPFYTNWLSVVDYGITDLIMVYVTFLLPIVSCTLADSLFVFAKNQNENVQKLYFSSGIVVSGFSFVFFAVVNVILTYVFKLYDITNSFVDYSWLIYFLVVVSFLQNYVHQFTRSIDRMQIYSIAGIILPGSMGLSSFMLIPNYGVYGFIYSQIISFLVTTLFSFFFSRSFKFISLKAFHAEKAKEMLRYSLPLIPNGIMWWLVGALNRPLIESYVGLSGNGLFAVASKFPGILTLLFTIFSTSWQISVLEEFNKQGYKEFYNKAFHFTFAFLIAISCFLAVFSKTLIYLMADEKFFDAWKLVPVLLFAVIFSSISSFVGVNFSATRESKYYFYSSIWGACAAIISNFLLIPLWGLMGAAFAVVLSHIAMAISRVAYSWKYVKIKQVHLYIGMLLINLILLVGVIIIPNISILMLLFCSLIIPFILLNKSLITDIRFFLTKK